MYTKSAGKALDGSKYRAGAEAIDKEFEARAKAIRDGYNKQTDTQFIEADGFFCWGHKTVVRSQESGVRMKKRRRLRRR